MSGRGKRTSETADTSEFEMAQAISLSLRPRWPEIKNDYLVRFEGHTIGHVRLAGSEWVWAITIPMALPDWTTGSGASLEDSIKALAGAWTKVLNQTPPERLQRAWDFENAAAARVVSKQLP
jgi:hypothetical protein